MPYADDNPFLSGMLDGITAHGLVQAQKIQQQHMQMQQDQQQRANAMQDLDSRLRILGGGGHPLDAQGGLTQGFDLGQLPGTGSGPQGPMQMPNDPGMRNAPPALGPSDVQQQGPAVPAAHNTLTARLQADPSMTVRDTGGQAYLLPSAYEQQQRYNAAADAASQRKVTDAGAVEAAKQKAQLDAWNAARDQSGLKLPRAIAELYGADPNKPVHPDVFKDLMAQGTKYLEDQQPAAAAKKKLHGFNRLGQPMWVNEADQSIELGPKVPGAAPAAAASGGGGSAALSPETIQWLAQNVRQGAPLPNLGRKSEGAIAAVLNEAAKGGGSLAGAKADYKANSGSLAALQKNRDAVVAFENTAGQNLDMFVKLASKIPDTGSPWLNTPLRSLNEKLLGSDDMAAVNAARQVATTEIAKVTSNPGLAGTLSDSARHEVMAYNPANATMKQTLAVAKVLKQDMAARHQSFDQQIREIHGRISGGASGSASPAAAAPAAPAAAVTHRFNPATGMIEAI